MASILDWVRSHPALDTVLAAAGLAAAVALFLAALCGTVYLALTLRRLGTERHVRAFLSRPIAPLHSAKILGQELSFREHVLKTGDTVERVEERLRILERVVGDLSERRRHETVDTEEDEPEAD